MAVLKWDEAGQHLYETGISKVVLYVQDTSGSYPNGVAWNGVSSISESPSGAEANALYADNTKYLNLYSNEDFGATLEAYTYPEEFYACDGLGELDDSIDGITISQQTRQSFGLCYRTEIGNDIQGDKYGYKLHLIYGCKASPSEKSYSTINESPEANTFSWEITTVPVNVEGKKPTSKIEIDSTKIAPDKLAMIEAKLYGTETDPAQMPTPAELLTLLK